MKTQSEQRLFDRFSLGFELTVEAEDADGKKFKEKTKLDNISGGGARFITRQADRYTPGQLLTMTITLPGTDEVKARMKGDATVIRVDTAENTANFIAVEFSARLNFER